MKTKNRLILGSLKNLPYLLMGLMMSTLVPTDASAGEHIQITREILIESGNAAIPNVLMLAADGDLILAGSLGPSAWATRVGPDGSVRWRHRVASTASQGPQLTATFNSMVILNDGSLLLCGEKDVPVGNKRASAGLLTHLDKLGNVLSEKVMRPKEDGDKRYGLISLEMCRSEGINAVVSGKAMRFGTEMNNRGELYSWSFRVDINDNLTSEKLTKYKDLPVHYSSSLPLQENGLVGLNISHRFDQPGHLFDTSIIHITPTGEVQARKSYSDTSLMLVEPVMPDGFVRLMPDVQPDSAYLLTLSPNLEQQERIDGLAGTALPKRAFYLPDHSVVTFGADYYQSNVTSASVAWLSPDLKRTERLMFEPPTEAGEIADAVPTGRPGEFVTARTVTPVRRIVGPDVSDRIGVAIAFIKIR